MIVVRCLWHLSCGRLECGRLDWVRIETDSTCWVGSGSFLGACLNQNDTMYNARGITGACFGGIFALSCLPLALCAFIGERAGSPACRAGYTACRPNLSLGRSPSPTPSRSQARPCPEPVLAPAPKLTSEPTLQLKPVPVPKTNPRHDARL